MTPDCRDTHPRHPALTRCGCWVRLLEPWRIPLPPPKAPSPPAPTPQMPPLIVWAHGIIKNSGRVLPRAQQDGLEKDHSADRGRLTGGLEVSLTHSRDPSVDGWTQPGRQRTRYHCWGNLGSVGSWYTSRLVRRFATCCSSHCTCEGVRERWCGWRNGEGERGLLRTEREGWQQEGLGPHSLEVPAAAGCAAGGEVTGTALSPLDARSGNSRRRSATEQED